jgi:hypothetical protein
MGTGAATIFAWIIFADAIGLMKQYPAVVIVVAFVLTIVVWIVAERHTDRGSMP